MTDDNGDDVQPKFTMTERTFGDITKCGQTDPPSQLHKDIWNRAIEKAAKIADDGDEYTAIQIRKLKL